MAAFAKCSDEGYIPVSQGDLPGRCLYQEHVRGIPAKKRSGIATSLPLHEQTGHLISGRMILNIRIEVNEMREEDSRVIPGNVTHRAKILADSVAVEIFSPVRDDYLPE